MKTFIMLICLMLVSNVEAAPYRKPLDRNHQYDYRPYRPQPYRPHYPYVDPRPLPPYWWYLDPYYRDPYYRDPYYRYR